LWGCEPALGDTDRRFCGSFKLFRPDGTCMPHEQCPMAEVVAGTLAEARDEEVLIERPDGSRITVIVNIRPFRNERGDVTGAINCFYDITARKHAEEALHESLDDMTRMHQVSTRLLRGGDLSVLLHEILDGAIEISGAQMGHIQLLEADLLRITAQRGFEEPFLEFFDAVYCGQGACGTAWQRGERVIVDDVAKSDIFVDTTALEAMLAAGALSVQSTPLLSRSGRVLGIFSTHYRHAPQQPSDRALRLLDILARQAADLIEHQKSEEARARADEERARLLASEHAARTQAEEANRAKDQFLAMASHELRTPLNAILGWAAILERSTSLDDAALKGLQSINRNTRTLAQLVDDLLDVSRMISGKMRLDVTPIDLGNVVDAAVETILPAASAKSIAIHVAVDPASRTMVGDATRLQQAVWNLLSNAVKFTAAGGRVDVTTRVHNGQTELTVTDSGIGINAAFLPYVFDRFRQADDSSTRTHTGLGLGLTIVRHIVELHGGRVRAESDGTNAGTRFVLQLPRKHSPQPTRDAREAAGISDAAGPDAPRFDGVRILIVDDDHESCEVMLEALRGLGASVWFAMSATEAIRKLSECAPDLVLSDIAMPGRDGYAVLTEVRQVQTALGRRVPVAAVSAYAHAEDRQRAIAAGFDQYLAKPVDPAALASTVKALVAIGNRQMA
jgi:signal transduction histidine kinase/ActR/RegA family two-component response regulator